MSHSIRDDGVIKYIAIHQDNNPPNHAFLIQLDEIRTKLFDLGLVGVYPDGIGYGNVSIRHQEGCIISGTATGQIRALGAGRYCYVRSFDLTRNTVHTEGPVRASSESMTHCAIYLAAALVNCVLHIHHPMLWSRLLKEGRLSTPANIPYGTPQMAQSIASLVNGITSKSGLLVMAGHEDGIIAYGETIDLAYDQIKIAFDQYALQ